MSEALALQYKLTKRGEADLYYHSRELILTVPQQNVRNIFQSYLAVQNNIREY